MGPNFLVYILEKNRDLSVVKMHFEQCSYVAQIPEIKCNSTAFHQLSGCIVAGRYIPVYVRKLDKINVYMMGSNMIMK